MNASSNSHQDVNETRDSGNLALIAGIALGVFWSAGVTAFLLGYNEGGFSALSPQQLAGLAFVSLAPAVVLAFAGWAAREVMRFAHTARLLDYSARRLAAPAANVKADARSVADAITEQVDRLSRETQAALERLGAMEQVIRHHAESLEAARTDARAGVDSLISDLRNERTELDQLTSQMRGDVDELAVRLRAEADTIAAAIEQQTELVRNTSKDAAAQAEEGRGLLDKSATAMTDAAGAAQHAAEKAAVAIDEQLRDMQALVTALEHRGGRLEDVARIHSENVKIVQQTAHDLNLAADAGADSMRSASEAAIEQARRLTEVIEKETQRAVERGMEEIERMRRAAQAAREAADSAGLALEANADAVIERVRAANAATLESARHHGASVPATPAPRRARSEPPPPPPERRPPPVEDDWDDERVYGDDLGYDEDRDYNDDRGYDEDRGYRAPRRRPSERAPDRVLDRPPLDLEDEAPPLPPPLREPERRPSRANAVPPSRYFDEVAREQGEPGYTNGRRPVRRGDELDEHRPPGAAPVPAPSHARAEDEDDSGEWRWRDLLKNIDEAPSAMLAGEAVVSGLRRAGVDPGRALDPDMTARVARARRRAGSGEARALVLDGALNDVRRTSAALAADPTLRGRAEEFVGEHARLVRRAIDENDAGLLSSLLDSDMGRAYLLLDAALSAD